MASPRLNLPAYAGKRERRRLVAGRDRGLTIAGFRLTYLFTK
jgi:hypothetical protein